jgi:hypothetical protein
MHELYLPFCFSSARRQACEQEYVLLFAAPMKNKKDVR